MSTPNNDRVIDPVKASVMARAFSLVRFGQLGQIIIGKVRLSWFYKTSNFLNSQTVKLNE